MTRIPIDPKSMRRDNRDKKLAEASEYILMGSLNEGVASVCFEIIILPANQITARTFSATNKLNFHGYPPDKFNYVLEGLAEVISHYFTQLNAAQAAMKE